MTLFQAGTIWALMPYGGVIAVFGGTDFDGNGNTRKWWNSPGDSGGIRRHSFGGKWYSRSSAANLYRYHPTQSDIFTAETNAIRLKKINRHQTSATAPEQKASVFYDAKHFEGMVWLVFSPVTLTLYRRISKERGRNVKTNTGHGLEPLIHALLA